MNDAELKTVWKKEEEAAYIHGWDFSHISGRYEVAADLPWDYEKTVRNYLKDSMDILDYDTGGGRRIPAVAKAPVSQNRGDRRLPAQRGIMPGKTAAFWNRF